MNWAGTRNWVHGFVYPECNNHHWFVMSMQYHSIAWLSTICMNNIPRPIYKGSSFCFLPWQGDTEIKLELASFPPNLPSLLSFQSREYFSGIFRNHGSWRHSYGFRRWCSRYTIYTQSSFVLSFSFPLLIFYLCLHSQEILIKVPDIDWHLKFSWMLICR